MLNFVKLFDAVDFISDLIIFSVKHRAHNRLHSPGRTYYDSKSGLVQILASQTSPKKPRVYCASPMTMQEIDTQTLDDS